MPTAPMPSGPPLDGVPPSPPGVSAGGGPNPQISQLAPSMQLSGSMQVVSLVLEAAGQAAKLLDMIGQVQPAAAPAMQMLIEQLRGALKSTLQQGSSGLESQPQPMVPQGAIPQQPQPTPGAPQAPMPAMPSGF